MLVRSVNVSLPKQIQHNRNTLSTAIFKQPVSGRIAVSTLNLEGDQQADLLHHGGEHKAVYGFAAEHYAFWEDKLGLPSFPFGKFGENLTVEGLDESQLCIGDRLQVGQCLLEITQPRVPCFKLGLAFGRHDLPSLFVENAATGIYFRVIKTGTVAAGDTVHPAEIHPARISVQQLFRAVFDKTVPVEHSNTVLQQALTIQALSDEWRVKLEKRLAQF